MKHFLCVSVILILVLQAGKVLASPDNSPLIYSGVAFSGDFNNREQLYPYSAQISKENGGSLLDNILRGKLIARPSLVKVIRDKEYTYQFVILNEVKDLLFKQKRIFAVAQDDSRGSEHGIFIDANNLRSRTTIFHWLTRTKPWPVTVKSGTSMTKHYLMGWKMATLTPKRYEIYFAARL